MSKNIGSGTFGGPDGNGSRGFGATPGRKFELSEIKEYLMNDIENNPSNIRSRVELHTTADIDHFNNVMWPLLIKSKNWYRTHTLRGDSARHVDEDGNMEENVSDREIRVFINEAWEDYEHDIEARIMTEFGEIKGIEYRIKY